MAMQKITIAQAKKIAENKGLKPGKVKSTTDGIQFTKGNNSKVEVITWEELDSILKKKKLAIYETGGFMKIMKA